MSKLAWLWSVFLLVSVVNTAVYIWGSTFPYFFTVLCSLAVLASLLGIAIIWQPGQPGPKGYLIIGVTAALVIGQWWFVLSLMILAWALGGFAP